MLALPDWMSRRSLRVLLYLPENIKQSLENRTIFIKSPSFKRTLAACIVDAFMMSCHLWFWIIKLSAFASKLSIFSIYSIIFKRDVSYESDTYQSREQRRLGRGCAYAQSRPSLRCSQRRNLELDNASDKKHSQHLGRLDSNTLTFQ